MKNIKLVIWDLDDTFWNGTLTEENISFNYSNIELVKKLVDRGIMNSIVSKNDYEMAKKKLEEVNIFEYFIIPQISWQPKGKIVKQLIENCALRAENTLFLDDNSSNLEEVRYYNPGINVELPEFLKKKDILKEKEFLGKDDKKHSRLKQYKHLENRNIQRNIYSSNIEFLRNSGIKIVCKSDCLKHEERIFELVNRTNQLNFTKCRIKKEELHKLFLEKDVTQTYYIEAKDNFGDYGLIGFYALKNNQLIHFLFSCRVLGLGIESYIFNKLGRPNIDIKEDVAIDLLEETDIIDWINESNNFKKNKDSSEKKEKDKLLMVGGCDLEQATFYLDADFNIRKEFAIQKEGRNFKTSDSIQLVNSLVLENSIKNEFLENIPFYNKDITYETKMFSGDYDIVIWSVVDDYIRGLYKHNTLDYYVSCSGYFYQEEYLSSFTKSELQYLMNNFTYVGREIPSHFEKNIRTIVSNLPKKTSLIIINGAEVNIEEWIGADRCQRQVEMNGIVDKIISEYQNVYLVDMRNIVKDKSVLTRHDNRHYNRKVYYIMAKELVGIIKKINNEASVGVIKRRNEFRNMIDKYINAIYRRIKRFRLTDK